MKYQKKNEVTVTLPVKVTTLECTDESGNTFLADVLAIDFGDTWLNMYPKQERKPLFRALLRDLKERSVKHDGIDA